MATHDPAWLAHWRGWLRARFGERLDDATLEAAAAACESIRSAWGPLLELPDAARPANGEAPFVNVIADGTPREDAP